MRRPDVRLELLGFAVLFALGYAASFPFALRAALRHYKEKSE